MKKTDRKWRRFVCWLWFCEVWWKVCNSFPESAFPTQMPVPPPIQEKRSHTSNLHRKQEENGGDNALLCAHLAVCILLRNICTSLHLPSSLRMCLSSHHVHCEAWQVDGSEPHHHSRKRAEFSLYTLSVLPETKHNFPEANINLQGSQRVNKIRIFVKFLKLSYFHIPLLTGIPPDNVKSFPIFF